jgi:hypothetical protein
MEFYPQVRAVHVGAVLCSGTLFALRGVGVLASTRWPTAAPLRYLSYGIDTSPNSESLWKLARSSPPSKANAVTSSSARAWKCLPGESRNALIRKPSGGAPTAAEPDYDPPRRTAKLTSHSTRLTKALGRFAAPGSR